MITIIKTRCPLFLCCRPSPKLSYYVTETIRFTHVQALVANDHKTNKSNSNTKSKFKFGVAAIGASIFLFGFYNKYFSRFKQRCFLMPFIKTCQLKEKQENHAIQENLQENTRSDLPIFSLEDVKKHGKDSDRIWVMYKRGVYDITDFIDSHPGGDKILLAAAGSIEPFWTVYAQHKTADVIDILESMRIGTLAEDDYLMLESRQKITETEGDPFYNDSIRHPALLINAEKPFNAETPPSLLIHSFITPNELFFIRNHMPVPRINEHTHKIKISGIGIKKDLFLNVADLKNKFEQVKIQSTIQCAGNRRNDMNNFKKVQGLMWTGTAISNAEWTGCRLRDVLINAGVQPDEKFIKHVQFEGSDMDLNGSRYGASIPFNKAMSPEVIIAYEMNGKPLSLDHGYPLRVIVPGIVGARQVKWLSNIKTANEESESHWQRKDYKALPNSCDIADPTALDSTPSIQECPVQSVICVPAPNAKIPLDATNINVSGYAWSGGGRGIIRVEVSCDGGRTWRCAKLHQCPGQDPDEMWAWTLWSIKLSITDDMKQSEHIELICKATDISYNTQPETPKGIWNIRGLLHNAWHRVPLNFRS